MNSLQLMMEAGNYLPEHIRPWLTWMQITLFLLPIVFIKHVAARYLLAAQLLNTVTAYLVFVLEGLEVTRLFGLGHFFWAYPLWLLGRDVLEQEWSLYRFYAGLAALTIVVSLVFDVRDTALWIMGDRDSILVDVPEGHPLSDASTFPMDETHQRGVIE